MDNLWLILVQFILRVTCGVAFAMSITPANKVTSGYYRVHLWVLMGLNTFAALAVFTARETFTKTLPYPALASVTLGVTIGLAVLSYMGAVIWLYERAALGVKLLYAIAAVSLCGAILASPASPDHLARDWGLAFFDITTSGLVLGATLAAMFLGHWYLNTPTMELAPLRRLIVLMMLAIAARSLVCALGLGAEFFTGDAFKFSTWAFVVMRWSSGILATFAMAWMAWQTLKIPNTQSATGILYAGVILAFIGELTAQLLSVSSHFPL